MWRWTSPDQVSSVWPGHHHALGATWRHDATNFAVWAPEATSMSVCCFDDDGVETRHLLPSHTLGIWHGEIPGIPVGQRYGYRAEGPWDPRHGHRFNVNKLLLDPYAQAICGTVDLALSYSPIGKAPQRNFPPWTQPTRCP